MSANERTRTITLTEREVAVLRTILAYDMTPYPAVDHEKVANDIYAKLPDQSGL